MFVCRIEDLSFEVGHLHGSLKRKESEWEGKEKGYKQEIEELEFKVNILFICIMLQSIQPINELNLYKPTLKILKY